MKVFTQKSRIILTMIAIAATTGMATTAQAASTTAPRYANVVVSYADLNLRSADGSKALYARLSDAASRACGSAPLTRSQQHITHYRACVERKLDRAVAKVGSRTLEALHESRMTRRAG